MELFSDFETWSAGTKIYFALSVFGGLALVIQIMLLAFGFGDADVDADLNPDFDPSVVTDIDADTGHSLSDVAGITYFSISSITAFICMFGWVGFASQRSGVWALPAFLMAFFAGSVALYVVAWCLFQMRKLTSRGNERISSAIGEIGTVYLGIPEGRNQTGRVIVTVSGRKRERTAVSEDGKAIATRERIKVTGMLDSRTLVVAPINTASEWTEKGI